ncbi:acyl-CoA dehydrogenase family protein [Streptomyces sp. NPDC021749]|uniref:acyl-CoA dehydrogenase family protein n=1 Tax=Streptomyces sp. NPDC021749 TaxID=3154905 RepID=UPI0033EA99FD
MDVTPTEEQSAAQQLAVRIFGDLATRDRLTAAGTASDAELWKALCAAGLPAAVEEIELLGLALVLVFGRPLSANQAVLLRAADAYMDTEAIRVTTYEAAWGHDAGLPYGAHALAGAWWASEAGRRVVHTGQHLHGVVGADLDHPVHRHFLWGRQLDAHLGCGAALLEELGTLLTDPPNEEAA